MQGTISASSKLGLLQMVSELDTGQCASEDSPKRTISVSGGLGLL